MAIFIHMGRYGMYISMGVIYPMAIFIHMGRYGMYISMGVVYLMAIFIHMGRYGMYIPMGVVYPMAIFIPRDILCFSHRANFVATENITSLISNTIWHQDVK